MTPFISVEYNTSTDISSISEVTKLASLITESGKCRHGFHIAVTINLCHKHIYPIFIFSYIYYAIFNAILNNSNSLGIVTAALQQIFHTDQLFTAMADTMTNSTDCLETNKECCNE